MKTYTNLTHENNALVKFINSNSDWLKILSDERGVYALKIKQSTWKGEENLWMFSYNQIKSNFRYQECCVARGIILEIIDNKVTQIVRHAFDKFFNSQEGLSAKIDFTSPDTVSSMKMDGSIIALYNYQGRWNWSTNGMFHAEDATLSDVPAFALDGAEDSQTFNDLIQYCVKKQGIEESWFLDCFTYVFELTSPRNRIVTPYQDTKLTLIGIRNNLTDDEVDVFTSPLATLIPTPEIFKFASLEEALESADKLPDLLEGYVTRGKMLENGSYERSKSKSASYIKTHHIRGENNFSNKQLFEVAQANETGEVEAYFPEIKEKIAKVLSSFNTLKERVLDEVNIGMVKWTSLCNEDPLYKYSDVNVKKKYETWVNSPEVDAGYRSFMFLIHKGNPVAMLDNYFKTVNWKDYKNLLLKINKENMED